MLRKVTFLLPDPDHMDDDTFDAPLDVDNNTNCNEEDAGDDEDEDGEAVGGPRVLAHVDLARTVSE
jgi:hypothetical protein